ncbi:MAG TPA: restriction endonuclease subunit S [Chitinophagaceae bacterium]|nr:restriction endonuclease subunit S [Chitinophagaceae bacterium]
MIKYDKYKPSGIDWLRDVPEKWTSKRIKDVVLFQGGFAFNSNDYIDEGVQLILIGNLYQNNLCLDRNPTFVSKGFLKSIPNYIVSKNDILISLTGTLGKKDYGFAIMLNSAEKYLLNQRVGCIRTIKTIFNRWYIYLMQSENFVGELLTLPKGTKQGNLSERQILSIEIPIPSMLEQIAIAQYLDSKTQAIDKKIALLLNKINYYKELSKSIINESVCRGLKKNVLLKESGIEWIKLIPKHWEVKRLKDIGYLYSGLSGKSGEHFNQEVNDSTKYYIPFTNIANNKYINHEDLHNVIMEENERQNKVKKDDLFFLMSSEGYADIGKAALLIEDVQETYLNSFCKGYRVTKKSVVPRYLNYQLNATSFRDKFIVQGKGFTRINLKMEKVNDFQFIIPPVEEQTAIADYLDNKTDTITAIITNITKQIEGLKELRKSLINDVVTCKLKVTA